MRALHPRNVQLKQKRRIFQNFWRKLHSQRSLSSLLPETFTKVPTKIVGVGRNYAEHAAELNNPVPESPLIFMKPTSTLINCSQSFYRSSNGDTEAPAIVIPSKFTTSGEVHHEVEIGLTINKEIGPNDDLSSNTFPNCIGGLFLAIDVTARDLQEIEKNKGLPWTKAKCFDTFAPIGDIFAHNENADDDEKTLSSLAPLFSEQRPLQFWVDVNGERRQTGNVTDMLFDCAKIVNYVASMMTLHPGDMILTGTPSGVGPLKDGDRLKAEVEDYPDAKLECVVRNF
eukprot:g1008.t1